jgi:hypothetical protein
LSGLFPAVETSAVVTTDSLLPEEALEINGAWRPTEARLPAATGAGVDGISVEREVALGVEVEVELPGEDET